MNARFEIVSNYKPTGDQPGAIQKLVESVRAKNRYQTLLGVTGSGKTFTVANLIQEVQKPTLILSHNKTLAAQLYSEFKGFFPNNAVEYFVSYYDYYQPEAYIPQTDTYIEKDSAINEEIERRRIATTSSLITRKDVIVVASISCIYGLGSPEDFKEMMIPIAVDQDIGRDILLTRLVENQYERNDIDFSNGTFRVRGDVVDIFPAYMESGIRVEFWGDTIESIRGIDPLTGELGLRYERFDIYPATQFITPRDKVEVAMKAIREELEDRVKYFEQNNLLLEAQRIRMRTEYDLDMLNEVGFCSGIENYSMHMSGRTKDERPWCLLDFFPEDYLIVIDESHVTYPQIRGMYKGDFSRKSRLVEFGFRLPSALANRPLRPDEFEQVANQIVFVSATPSQEEINLSQVVAEQLIRPTGLLDPIMEVRPIKGQVDDLRGEIQKATEVGERILVTTLTKRMAEDLSSFLREVGVRVEYLHSDIDAIERVEILRNLRRGEFDVLVGINLLREGLDLPEVALVAILDADKEGFLRSTTSLVQTAGRAARHVNGRVIFYADVMTRSLAETIRVCTYRREKQEEYNEQHGIIPQGVHRSVEDSLHYEDKKKDESSVLMLSEGDEDVAAVISSLEEEMLEAARNLEFEKAALLRDQIAVLKKDMPAEDLNKRGYKKKFRRKPIQ